MVIDYRPCACVGVVRILYLKVYNFPHTRRHFVGQWNSSNVHVDLFGSLPAMLTAGSLSGSRML